MIHITKIYLCNGERSEPIEIDKFADDKTELKQYRERLIDVMSRRKGHPVQVNFQYKEK